MDETSLKKLKVAELKELLGKRELPTTGKKEELIQRLLDAQKEPGTQAETTAEEPKLNAETKVAKPEAGEKSVEASVSLKPVPVSSEMTEEEKRIARAKRFGLPVPDSSQAASKPALKAAGLPEKRKTETPAKAKQPVVTPNLGISDDVLKKRAERFGNAPALEEEEAAKKRRLEKFGN